MGITDTSDDLIETDDDSVIENIIPDSITIQIIGDGEDG